MRYNIVVFIYIAPVRLHKKKYLQTNLNDIRIDRKRECPPYCSAQCQYRDPWCDTHVELAIPVEIHESDGPNIVSDRSAMNKIHESDDRIETWEGGLRIDSAVDWREIRSRPRIERAEFVLTARRDTLCSKWRKSWKAYILLTKAASFSHIIISFYAIMTTAHGHVIQIVS
jgi:hypothetical protein